MRPVATMPGPVVFEDGCIVLCLPLPSRECSPNARRGESRAAAIRKSKVVKRHRVLAQLRLHNVLVSGEVPDGCQYAGYSLAFFFRTAAFRDDDNADASVKAYRDGFASALRMDDRGLRKIALSSYAKDAAFPRVEITLYPKNAPHNTITK